MFDIFSLHMMKNNVTSLTYARSGLPMRCWSSHRPGVPSEQVPGSPHCSLTICSACRLRNRAWCPRPPPPRCDEQVTATKAYMAWPNRRQFSPLSAVASLVGLIRGRVEFHLLCVAASRFSYLYRTSVCTIFTAVTMP